MGKLLERLLSYYLKSKFMDYKVIQEQEEVQETPVINKNFKNIELGDIIIASRYKNEQERELMPSGHKSGPFIVIENNGDTLKAIYVTSNKNVLNDYRLMKYFTIESDDLHKETVFIIDSAETIDDYRFKSKVGSLTKEELKHLVNKLNGLEQRIELNENLIVKYGGEFYFVKELNDTYATLIHLVKGGKKNLVTINGIKFEVLFTNLEFAFNFDKLKIVDIVTERTAKLINKKYDENKKENTTAIAERGNLINYNGNLYYVNGVTGQTLNCFRIKNVADKQHRIIISGAPYEACFDETKDINSRSLYEICLRASDKEMDAIKEVKKQYAYEQKHSAPKKQKKLKRRIIKAGSIVVEKLPLDKEKFVVLRRINNTLYAIKLEDAKQGRFERIFNVDVHQVDYVGTYDEYKYYELCTNVHQVDDIAVTEGQQLKKQD